jgi:hypothetical protein
LVRERPVGQLLLGGAGLFLLAAGLLGYFAGQDDEIAGGFFVLVGLLVVVLAAFYPRLDGLVELGLLKIPAVDARRAEKQLERGMVVAGSDLEATRKALEQTVSRHRDARYGTPAATPGAVVIAELAVLVMATLRPDVQLLVHAEIARMGRPDFRPHLDPGPSRPVDAARSYRMHRVPDCDVRLWYRQRDTSQPYPLCVVVVEDTDKDR